MKTISSILFLILNLSLKGQVEISSHVKNDISYIEFIDSSGSQFISNLNKKFGYNSMIREVLTEAPNNYTSDDIKKMTIADIKEIISKNEVALAYIDIHVDYNDNGFVVLDKIITNEGRNKVTNSLHSSYGYDFPIIIDMQNNRLIENISEILDQAGINYIKQIAKKEFGLRTEGFCDGGETNECSIRHREICSLRNNDFTISNPDDNIFYHAGIYFHFSLTENYLVLESNKLNHQSILCLDPSSKLEIPWVDLEEYLLPGYKERMLKPIIKTHDNGLDTLYVVHSEYINLLPLPSPEGSGLKTRKISPYVIKGDKIRLLDKLNNRIKVEYVSNNNKVYRGWVKEDTFIKSTSPNN